MFPDINAFIAELDRRKELARDRRAGQPESRDRRRSSTAPASRPAAGRRCCSSSRPARTMPVAANLFGSMSRICLALGVETLDDLAREIEELTTPPMPRGLHGRPEDDAARQPADGSDAEDGQGRAVSGSRQAGRRPRRAAGAQDLAGGRRAVHHAAARHHARSRNRHAQHRHLPHAGVRPAHDRHALAAAQGRRAAPSRRRAARQAARRRRRARRRSGAALLRRPRRCRRGSTS